MNNQEAKFILLAYRPNGADASDPQFRAALAQANSDPELSRWLADQRRFDLSVRNKLRPVVVPPPDLKSHLLALRDVVRPIPIWKRPAWLAAAASIALLLAASAALMLRNNQLPSLRYADEMVQHAIQPDGLLALSANSMPQISEWLKNRHMDADVQLPPALSNMPVTGCRIVPWKGMSVPMISLTVDGTNHVNVFVTRASGFPEAAPAFNPQFQNNCHLTTAEWSTKEWVYFVTAEMPEESVRKLFSQGVAQPSDRNKQ